MNFHLRSYTAADLPTVNSWIPDAAMLFQFAATDFSFPITQQQLDDYRATRPGREFYIACLSDGIPFAFGEIIPATEEPARLARLIVDPAQRGQGLGEIFVNLLLNECLRIYGNTRIELYVWENNVPAISCYSKAGFRFTDESLFLLHFEDRAFGIRKMYKYPILGIAGC